MILLGRSDDMDASSSLPPSLWLYRVSRQEESAGRKRSSLRLTERHFRAKIVSPPNEKWTPWKEEISGGLKKTIKNRFFQIASIGEIKEIKDQDDIGGGKKAWLRCSGRCY